MLIHNLGTVETRINERGHVDYLAEVFNCIDTLYPNFYQDYHHVFNIDPRYPGRALSALEFT
jgi:hypothetical protein